MHCHLCKVTLQNYTGNNNSGGGSNFSLVRQIHTFYFHSSFCIKGTMLLKFEFEICGARQEKEEERKEREERRVKEQRHLCVCHCERISLWCVCCRIVCAKCLYGVLCIINCVWVWPGYWTIKRGCTSGFVSLAILKLQLTSLLLIFCDWATARQRSSPLSTFLCDAWILVAATNSPTTGGSGARLDLALEIRVGSRSPALSEEPTVSYPSTESFEPIHSSGFSYIVAGA